MAAYRRAMDALYLLCMAVAGLSLTIMTLVIPLGVYWRYVLNSAMAWPEPLSVLLVVLFTFTAAAACYRASVHISVTLVTDALPHGLRRPVLLGAGVLDLQLAGRVLQHHVAQRLAGLGPRRRQDRL